MTTRTIARIALVALLAGCGEGSGPSDTDGGANQPPPGPEPALPGVVVLDGDVTQASDQQTATLHLRNDGGAGSYRLQFWGKPTMAGGPDILLADTDPIEVTADYDAEVSYRLDPEPEASFVVVFTRDASNNKFLETDRFDFP